MLWQGQIMKIELIGKYKVELTGFWEGLFKELRKGLRKRDGFFYLAKKI